MDSSLGWQQRAAEGFLLRGERRAENGYVFSARWTGCNQEQSRNERDS